MQFAHEKLDVYVVAREFRALASEVARELPRGEADLKDQLSRAARSISLNIAEGAGRRPGKEKARFFEIARGSANECAAILDEVEVCGLARRAVLGAWRPLLHRIVQMLSGLSRSALARAAL